MRKIIASTFVTLDGVMEAPGSGDPTLPEYRGWSEPFMTPEMGQLILEQMDASDAMLLGRKTYQNFAAFWPNMPDDDPFAHRMNTQTKYVVSTTLDKVEWQNSHLIKGDLVEEITKLKRQPGRNIAITGSGTLIQSLLRHNLIDEYQLALCPVVLGVGERLFDGELDGKRVLKLADTRTFSTGMVMLTYRCE
ncbi:MAG TPA: dihydrofolate reductase family protein [Aggregatilinea sp.]|uniref:dihydrofolate reductase family protein n=1 Tax=Aggregatilinea sp. TaxID=2806333 RepID=UPI002BB49743|nr:dihydrofolate reductase family protein [Aggregatilinea sp.]HML21134.1 dihydrofolate reductase family protein [Aggregatilinea sp.]